MCFSVLRIRFDYDVIGASSDEYRNFVNIQWPINCRFLEVKR